MPTRSELQVTSFDHDELKRRLIEFMKSTKFGDFDYEGSAINTIIDLLTRNTHYDAYMANFLAGESFIDSAQLRASVSSHAQKLSYVPRSRTASRIVTDIEVIPANPDTAPPSIRLDAGATFLASGENKTYSFVAHRAHSLNYSEATQSYQIGDVELFQGQRISNKFIHRQGQEIVIPNANCDTSTLIVTINDSDAISGQHVYNKVTSITELSSDRRVYFLGENLDGLATIQFGRDVLGLEPPEDSIVTVSYINTEDDHALGVSKLVPATTVEGYSNIKTTVTAPSYGGSEREDIEDVRFLAPRAYQAQERALTDSDYIPLIKRQFSFVRSAISWGGEKNDPPRYGAVFVSILSQEGGLITNTVKNQIVDYLSDYNVGSITPIIVDPVQYGIDLNVSFAHDHRKTSKNFDEMSVDVKSVVRKYNDQELNNFGLYFNESLLASRLQKLRGMDSVYIDKTIYYEFPIMDFNDPVYEVNFYNEIKPGSVWMENFTVDMNASEHRICDDSNGNLVLRFAINGVTTERNVGTVNYATGSMEFVSNIIQTNRMLRMTCKPASDNFYVGQNRVAFIDTVETNSLNTQTR